MWFWRRLLPVTAVGAPLALGSGWARDRAEDVAWTWAVERPLSKRQARTLSTCEAVPTAVLAKVVHQDLGVACGEPALLNAIGFAASKDDSLRGWLVARADANVGRPRLRAATAAYQAEAPIDLGGIPWTEDESSSLVLWVADGLISGNWLDPAGEDALALVQRDPRALSLRLAAAAAAGVEDPIGLRLAGLELGIPPGKKPLETPTDEWPPALLPALARHGEACAAGWCEALFAEWLVTPTADEWTRPPSPPPASPISALAGWGRGAKWEAEQELQLARWASWVGASDRPSNRLWRAVGSGRRTPTTTPAAALGHGGTPWVTAWLASELGRRVGVEVVAMAPEGRPVLKIGGAVRTLEGCGTGDGDPWPADAVLAAALREAGETSVGHRLDTLGVAWNPEPATGNRALGRVLGARLVASAPIGAETERARADGTSCPPFQQRR